MTHHHITTRVDPRETCPLKSPDLVSPNATNETTKKIPWHSSVTLTFIALLVHLVIGLGICVIALCLTYFAYTRSHGWLSLYGFGGPLTLLKARYLNFGLDICARALALTLEVLLAFVGIRTATALWSSSQGIRISDAISFNCIQLEATSLWTALRTRADWTTRVGYILTIVCGLVVYLSSSLIFGYENIASLRPEVRELTMGANLMFLGSNVSGLYVPPDYSSLILSSSRNTSPFINTTLHTLMQIDLSGFNESISTFNLYLDSYATLQANNINMVLVNQTVSSRLTDCQPASVPIESPLGFSNDGMFITGVEQSLASSITSEAINQFREELYTAERAIFDSKFQTYTWLMTLVGSSAQPESPADESQVLIMFGYKGGCASDPFNTQFGPMSHIHGNLTNINQATLVCRNMRTITRSTYGPSGKLLEQTSESFYVKPILSVVNGLYLYPPIKIEYVPNNGNSVPPYEGIGALLNKDMLSSSRWTLPSCIWGNPTIVQSNSTELAAISAAWSRVVDRVQHYETSILQAFVSHDTTMISTPVTIVAPAYRLAVIPGVLLIYGVTVTITACMLLLLLSGVGDKRKDAVGAESLTLWRVANELGISREEESKMVEKSDSSLERELGVVRIRRRTRSVM